MSNRCSDDDERQQRGAPLGDGDDRRVDGVEQDVLHEEVVDRVPREAQLGEEGDGDVLVVARPSLVEHPLGVGRRVRQGNGEGARGHPGEPLGVHVPEVHGPEPMGPSVA